MSSPCCRGRQTSLAKVEKRIFGNYGNNGSSVQLCYLVVYVAVGKHCVEVLDTFLGIPVVTVLKPFLDCSHVHRILNYCVVVLKIVAHKYVNNGKTVFNNVA